jgi:hypothetical protein
MLGIKARASHLLGKHLNTEEHYTPNHLKEIFMQMMALRNKGLNPLMNLQVLLNVHQKMPHPLPPELQ